MGQFTFKQQGAKTPTAAGSLLQQSAYGQTIPNGYGTTQSPLLPIWAANLRQGGSLKKFKQFKKGVTTYVENIDFLLGHAPIMGVLQVMVNGGNFPLGFTSQTFVDPSSPLTVTDPNFCFVTAVTIEASYSFAVDDYGGTGPQTLTGTFEIPLWNELEQGPDPTSPSNLRNFPYCYRWDPSYGASVFIDSQTFSLFTAKVYYAYLTAATSNETPIAKLQCAFEPQLGSGSEYSDAGSPFDAQQIIYPQFAGLGSSQLDLGSTGALPQLLPEVRFKWGLYPSMDADFVDMIEDIFKSGLAQAAIQAASTPAFTQMERGLSSYDLPGIVQAKVNSNVESYTPGFTYNLPVTEGDFLVVIACGEPASISDSLTNTWTAVFAGSLPYQVWYAKANATGTCTVTLSGLGDDWQAVLLEIAGVDTFDAVSVVSGEASSYITAGNAPGYADFLLAIGTYSGAEAPVSPLVPQWDSFAKPNQFGFIMGSNAAEGGNKLAIFERIIRNPGTYPITIPGAHTPLGLAMLSFKATQPASFPRPLGDFIDFPSLDLVRFQCRAYGLWGSLSMNSQSSASDWLKTLYAAANAAPVFLGAKLFSYPYAEQSMAGNGATYTSPTASGPIANLSDLNGDYTEKGCPEETTVDRVGMPNVLQLQCIDRNTNYNQVTLQQPEAATLALYGERKGEPVVNNAIQDPSVGRAILGVMVRRNQYGGDAWTFSVTKRWSLLSPMDLITLTDTLQDLTAVPVRITSFVEQKDGSFEGAAEPFIYGMSSPTALDVVSPTVNPNTIAESAGDVNPPIIFEPVPDLYPSQTGDQLWLVISSPAENYGGAQVFISTDGGSSYNPAPGLANNSNVVVGNATTGVTTADWPAASDPDTTNDLELDMSESNGILQSYPTAARDNFEYPCYVEAETFGLQVNGAPVANGVPLEVEVDGTPVADLGTLEVNTTAVAESGAAAFDYELMSYNAQTLTAPEQYTLEATGSGNELRRGVFGAPSAGEGVDHATGSRFALLSPAGTGILKLAMPTLYVGQELYFKILSFNQFGSALQSLADVPAYTYTPTGIPGGV